MFHLINKLSQHHYGHKMFPGEKLICVAKRHRARELEEIVFNHLTQELIKPGYLNDVWKIKEAETKVASLDSEREKRRLEEELLEVDEEIRSTIRMSREMTSKSL